MRRQSPSSPPRLVDRPWSQSMAIWKPTTAINSDRRRAFYPKATISLRSDGGSVVAGIQIGENIRLKGFTTVVAGDPRCASACAIAWLGGTPRLMSAEARVGFGFHAAYDNKTGEETGVGNALVGAYLNKIGLPYSAVIYITQAAPNSMTWLSIADAEKQGIDVKPLRSSQIVHTTSHGTDQSKPRNSPCRKERAVEPGRGGCYFAGMFRSGERQEPPRIRSVGVPNQLQEKVIKPHRRGSVTLTTTLQSR